LTKHLYELVRISAQVRAETRRVREEVEKTIHDARNLRLAAQLMRNQLPVRAKVS
jgi:hypothetical protein